jgi:hypothetical protein
MGLEAHVPHLDSIRNGCLGLGIAFKVKDRVDYVTLAPTQLDSANLDGVPFEVVNNSNGARAVVTCNRWTCSISSDHSVEALAASGIAA